MSDEVEVFVPNFRILEGLSKGPESQIDPQMAKMLGDLTSLDSGSEKTTEEVKNGLRKALDYGARYALASGFVMNVLHVEWERLGGKSGDPTPWRAEIE